MAFAKLTPAVLAKKNSNTGEQRIDILERAVKNNTPLVLVDDSEIVLANSEANLTAIDQFRKDEKAFELTVKGGQRVIKSSDLAKTALFGGGGGGAGGGTAQTAVVESAQCVYLQAMLDNPRKPIEFFTPAILKKAYGKVKVGSTSFDQIRDMDTLWHVSAFKSAEILIDKGHVNKNQVFHRDSNEMKLIYKMKNTAFKNSDLEVMSDDKWNPGDIWAIEKNFDVKSMNTRTIQEYNADILQAFKSGNCVGISLKQVKKVAKVSTLNETNARPSKLKYMQSKTQGQNRNNTFFTSKGGQIIYSDGKMECRPNSGLSIIKAEIIGKTARGGGASWGPISEIVYDVSGVKLPMNSAIVNDAKAIKSGNKQKLNNFWNMAKLVNKEIKEKEFKDEVPKMEIEWIHGKYGVCCLLSTLEKNKGQKADRMVNSIHNYAGSQGKLSSVYLKVYE